MFEAASFVLVCVMAKSNEIDPGRRDGDGENEGKMRYSQYSSIT